MKRTSTTLQLLALGLASISILTAGCGTARQASLGEVARSKRQWTGVAVSDSGRIFVNYPRWSDDVPVSVAELKNDKPVPYPDDCSDGRNEIVVRDPRLAWPDTFAVGPEGALYVTTSQIHTQPNPEYPYFLFKIER